jgi:hypothetical protein
MAAGFAEIALALAELPIFCGRFQTAAHRNLYPSVIQWRHCCRSMKKRVLLPRALPRKKGQRARRGAGGRQQARGNSSGRVGMFCSLSRRCARILSRACHASPGIMSSSSPVRRIGMTLTEPPQRRQTSMSMRMAAPGKNAMVAGLGVPVPLTLGLGRTALGRGPPIAQ